MAQLVGDTSRALKGRWFDSQYSLGENPTRCPSGVNSFYQTQSGPIWVTNLIPDTMGPLLPIATKLLSRNKVDMKGS